MGCFLAVLAGVDALPFYPAVRSSLHTPRSDRPLCSSACEGPTRQRFTSAAVNRLFGERPESVQLNASFLPPGSPGVRGLCSILVNWPVRRHLPGAPLLGLASFSRLFAPPAQPLTSNALFLRLLLHYVACSVYVSIGITKSSSSPLSPALRPVPLS